MKIRIDRNGVYSGPKASPVPIGAVMRVRDGFKGWPGKWSAVPENTPVTFPAPETDTVDEDEQATADDESTADQDSQDSQGAAWGDEDDETEAVRARYEVVFGKKPHGNATVKTMQEAIDKEMGN